MKVAILAGGKGTRLSNDEREPPKPAVEIGGQPILWHVMRYYAHFGFDDFVVALGHRADEIRSLMDGLCAEWRVDFVDTGQQTATGGRVKRLEGLLGDGTFMLAYSDGLSDVDLIALLRFHQRHGRRATVTAVHPPARFGRLELEGDRVLEFAEKRCRSDDWINGAFLVCEPGLLDYIDGDGTSLEAESLERLAEDGELMAFRHEGFWQCMDTPADRRALEELTASGRAPWEVWR